MLDAIFSRPVKALKLLAKVQCVLACVVSVMLYAYVYEGLKYFSFFAAIVLGLVAAVGLWILQMFHAWAMYAFAELVEYTRATHEELSNMSSGLAEYTKAMSRTINTMNRELCVIAKHYHAEEEARDNNTVSAQAAADTNDIEEN